MASSQPASPLAPRKRNRLEPLESPPQFEPAKSTVGHLISMARTHTSNAGVNLPHPRAHETALPLASRWSSLSRCTVIFQRGLIPEDLRMLVSALNVGEILVQKMQEMLLNNMHEMVADEVGVSESTGDKEPGTDDRENVQHRNAAAVTRWKEAQPALSCSMAVSAPSSHGDEEMEEVPSAVSSEWVPETMDWEADMPHNLQVS